MKVKKEMEVLSRAVERAVLTPQEKVAVGRSLQRLAAIMAGYSDAGDKGVIGGYNGTFPLTAATAGNIYLEPKTGKYYRCETNYNGTQITGPNSNFVDLSVVANADRLNNLIKVTQENYGGFDEYRDINYPEGFNPLNCSVVITDVDVVNKGICIYSLSSDKKQFKGQRLNGSYSEANHPLFLFIKK